MGSVRARKETGLLFLDFRYEGQRRREQTALANTAENRRRLGKSLERIEQQIAAGTFDYAKTFPGASQERTEGRASMAARKRASTLS